MKMGIMIKITDDNDDGDEDDDEMMMMTSWEKTMAMTMMIAILNPTSH